ncbi:MAG: adenylate/guanylate cyclase domain-containing protein [Chthoniobacterales bacterium]
MAGPASKQFHLEIAHILFLDTVGYSKLMTKEQRELQDVLNTVVRTTARFQAAEASGRLIRLPTGDGMALVFTDSLESPIICALEISRAIQAHPRLRLRMGIHSGSVTRVVDVNDQSNVVGAGMNMAERVMSCADANHILLSQRAAEDLSEYDRWRPYLHELGECKVKHGVRLSIVNFYDDQFGNADSPAKFKEKAAPASFAGYLRSGRGMLIAGGLVVLLLLGGYFVLDSSTQRERSPQIASPPLPAVDKSIAVLPFENLSENKADAIFVNGVQDEILTNLSRVANLKVISRTSTLQYRGGMERNLREIGQALGAAFVVEGSVQRNRNQVRVNVQLIDARSDTHVWAQSYDRDEVDAFALESELAKTIAEKLEVELSPAEKAAIEEQSTSDPLAHDLYTEGNTLLSAPRFNVQGTLNKLAAADLFAKAVARDPNYFQAYCKLASVHDQIYLNGPDHTPARLALAEAALKAAQRLRPDAGETHLALAEHLYCGHLDHDRARQELELARRSLPNEPLIFELTGFIDRRRGRWEESTTNLLRALDLDPRNTYFLQQLAVSYQFLRRFDEAAAMLDRALTILPNDPSLRVIRAGLALHARADPRPMHQVIDDLVAHDRNAVAGIADEWLFLALCERDLVAAEKAISAMTADGYSNQGVQFTRAWCDGLVARIRGDASAARSEFAAARTEVESSLRSEPNHAQALSLLGMIDAALGQKEDAIREGRRAVELQPLQRNSIDGALAIEYLAVTYAWAGETEQALEQLKRATTIPGDVSYGQLRLHPFWDPLRGDPRFERIVTSLAPAAVPPAAAR